MKKVISLFLFVVMLLSVTTGISFGAQAEGEISSVVVNITKPVPGVSLSREFSIETVGLKAWSINGNQLNWYDVTDQNSYDKLLADNTKFVAGHKYKAVIVFGPESGYSLSDNLNYTLGGVTGVATQYQGRKKSVVQQMSAVFDCDYTYISSVVLSGEALAKGDVLENDHFISLTPHVNVFCAFTRNGEPISLGEKVTYGNYGATVILVPDESYEFKGNVEIKYGQKTFTLTNYIGRGIFAKSADDLWVVDCTHNYGSWQYDATTHWKACSQCGDKSEIDAHTFNESTVNGGTVYTCSVCGYVKNAKNIIDGYLYADVDGGVQIVAYSGSEVNLNIPATLNDKKVVSIGDYAFAKYDNKTTFKSITVPTSVTSIGRGAFDGCYALTSVNIPSGIKRIEAETFLACSSLGNVTIPFGVNLIGDSAFQDSGISSLVIPCSVKAIKGSAFCSCVNLGSIVIPDSVAELGNAFLSCSNLKTVVIGNGVTSIAQATFDGCTALETIVLPAGLTSIGRYNLDNKANFSNIYFRGTQTQWNAVSIASYNTNTATVTYDYAEKFDFGQHKYSVCETVAPTCVSEGYTLNMCEGCSDAFKTDVTPATGVHEYNSGAITTPPTCVDKGVKTYFCNVCGVEKSEEVDATGVHTYDEGVVTNPTCTEEGKIVYSCTVCGDTKTEVLNPTGHTWDNGKTTKQPTFKKTGVNTFTCVVCGATKTTTIAKLKATALKKVTKGKKSFKATWKKVAGIDGYQIQYCTSNKFKNKVKGKKQVLKKVTVKKAKTTLKTVKKLKAKKTYYVRIRAYKKINGKNVYSSWSKSKTVKTK